MSWFNLIAPACILAAVLLWLVSLLAERTVQHKLPPPAREARRGCYDAWRHP